MSEETYEIMALLMRYVFVAIGVLIVIRAYIWLRKDHREFMKVQREQPQIGRIGEIRDEDSGKTWPICQEGLIGSAGSCDVCIRKKGLKRRHAVYRFVPGKGLLLTATRRSEIRVDGVRPKKEALALSNSVLQAGDATLRIRLNRETGIPEKTDIIPPPDDEDSWMRLFEGGADPESDDPLSPQNDTGIPGAAPGAEAFLPDRTERKER